MSGGVQTRSRERWLAKPARGLDGLNLFVANIQTGFGPFIAVYLTGHGWTQTAIGFALSIGTVTAMASQIPAGAVVDAIRNKSLVAGLSIVAFSVSALLFAVRPTPLFVYIAEILHGFSSCTLGPAIAAISLVIAGATKLGIRFGRNARYASIGNGVGAALMGAAGYYISDRSVFFLTAILTLPALLTLIPLRHAGTVAILQPKARRARPRQPVWRILADRRLLLFTACLAAFSLANGAMLPIAGGMLTMRAGSVANLLIAGAIVLPQAIVALISPTVGRIAGSRGRRTVMLAGFAVLPIRGILLATIHHPLLIVLIQSLDGVAGAALGILTPLVTSDLTARSGHFNISLGFVGLGIGLGATCSTTMGGWIADEFGAPAALLTLAAIGAAAFLLVWLAMPETREAASDEESPALLRSFARSHI